MVGFPDISSEIQDRIRSRISQRDIQPAGLRKRAGISEEQTYTAIVSKDGSGDFNDIQQAINYVKNIGGGNIYIRSGVYNIISTIKIDSSNILLIGEKRENTTIRMADGSNLSVLFLILSSNCAIENITIDGNSENNSTENILIKYSDEISIGSVSNLLINEVNIFSQSGVNGSAIYNEASGLFVTNSEIVSCEGSAINGSGSNNSVYFNIFITSVNKGIILGAYDKAISCYVSDGSSTGYDISGQYATLIGCVAIVCGDSGFLINSYGTKITSCDSINSNANGFEVTSSGKECFISNCVSTVNVRSGFYSTGAYGVNINNCSSTFNGYHGIHFYNCSKSSIVNNYIDGEPSSDNTYNGIFLEGTSTKNRVLGNEVVVSQSNNYAYGIREDSVNNDYNIIANNIVEDGQTAKISIQGANSVDDNNISI